MWPASTALQASHWNLVGTQIVRLTHIYWIRNRELIPRQIDKKSRVPKEQKGIWGSWSGDWGSGILKEEKRTIFFFPSTFLLLLLLSRFSCVRLCATPQTAAHQAPLSLGFSRQEHWRVAISFSNAWKWKVKVKSLSRVRLLATPWTAAYQASESMGFSRQEYWSGGPLLHSLVLVNYTTQFKLCSKDYTTTMYLAGAQFPSWKPSD